MHLPATVTESPRLATLSLWCESTTEVLTARPTPWVRWRAGEIGKAWIFRPFTILSSSPPAQYPQVIPEGALVVKAALLEEEHDFGVAVLLST